jgi:protein gp37
MAKNSSIEWTHHTFNPWWGCTRVSPACKHCYAERFAHRLGLELWGNGFPRKTPSDAYWRQPIGWNKEAERQRRRARVFCASMADVFESRPDLDGHRARLWALIAATPMLDWLLLTKRPECVAQMIPWGSEWPENVWIGTTMETQKWANLRAPHLVSLPARFRFVSCEPLLGAIDIRQWLRAGAARGHIDWVIVGGESGHHARPMNPDWARNIRAQCLATGTPFHFKQWGNWRPAAGLQVDGHRVRNLASANGEPIKVVNLGKKDSGRRLDGREWNGLPVGASA